MSSKTKIVVLRMKEVVYTGIFAALGILLIILLFFMFFPKNKKDSTVDTVPTMAYHTGVYSTPITLNHQKLNIEVVVDKEKIHSIRLADSDESVTSMFPLVKPTLEELAKQIYENQSLENVTYSENNKYTSMLLMEAIQESLDKAESNQN